MDNFEICLNEFTSKNNTVQIIRLTETFIRAGDEFHIYLKDFKLVGNFCRQQKKRGTCILEDTLNVNQSRFVMNWH